jgi:hypothetical protein
MELVTHKKFKSGRLMPWGKCKVVADIAVEIVAVAGLP